MVWHHVGHASQNYVGVVYRSLLQKNKHYLWLSYENGSRQIYKIIARQIDQILHDLISPSRKKVGLWDTFLVGSVRRMNEVNPRRGRLVLGWVTVFRRVYHLGM